MANTFQGNPATRTIFKLPDGTLMYADRCCCVQLSGHCCCDTNLPAWFMSPVSVTITAITRPTGDFDPTNNLDLECLLGTWVCPFLKLDELQTKCTWQNVFSAGDEPDSAVFKITVDVPKSSDINSSTNLDYSINPGHSTTKLADKVSTVTIEILSCRDCLGHIMQNKPDFIVDHKTYNCGASSDPSFNGISGDVCGCSEASVLVGYQNKNIDGSWNPAFTGTVPWSLNADLLRGYYGACWSNPDATYNYGGTLELFEPRMIDESGVEHSCHLAFMERSITCKRDPANECRWLPDPSSSEIDYIAADIIVDGSSCQTSTRLQSNYLTGVDGFSCSGVTFNAVSAPHLTYIGCLDKAPWVWATLATATSHGHTYKIQIKAGWFPIRRENCVIHAGVVVGSDPCLDGDSFNICDCNPEDCLGSVYPEGALFTAGLYKALLPSHETATDLNNCTPSASEDSSNGDASFNCTCSEKPMCNCAKITVNIPQILKADDYAPAGARYEVLVDVKTFDRNEQEKVMTYSLVYTKQLGEAGVGIDATYPKGSWTLDWNISDPSFKLLGALGAYTTCTHKDKCKEIIEVIKNAYHFKAGRVPATSLYRDGIWTVHTYDPSDEFATIQIELRDREPTIIDPCCSCVDKSSDPADYFRLHCNLCTCEYKPDGEGSGGVICKKPVHVGPNESSYPCRCYGITNVSGRIFISRPGVLCGTSAPGDGAGCPPTYCEDASSNKYYSQHINNTAFSLIDCEWVNTTAYGVSSNYEEPATTAPCGELDGSHCHKHDFIYTLPGVGCTDALGNEWKMVCREEAYSNHPVSAPGPSLGGYIVSDTWSRDQQRWSKCFQDVIYNDPTNCSGASTIGTGGGGVTGGTDAYCGGGSCPSDTTCGPPRYLNTCSGTISEFKANRLDCAGLAYCEGEDEGLPLRGDNKTEATYTYTYGKLPCCDSRPDSGAGGPYINSDCVVTPPGEVTGECVALSFFYTWSYRLTFGSQAEADDWIAAHSNTGLDNNHFTATVLLYPGNGVVICKEIESADPYSAACVPWDGSNICVYVDFTVDFTDNGFVDNTVGYCADISNPYIQIGHICPTIPGILVDRQVTGDMMISTDSVCDNPDCDAGIPL